MIAEIYDALTRQLYGGIDILQKEKTKEVIKLKRPLDLSKIGVGTRISASETGSELNKDLIVTDTNDIDKGEFIAKETDSNNLWHYKYDSATKTATWERAGTELAKQISNEISAGAVLRFVSSTGVETVLEDLLNAMGITKSSDIDDTVQVINDLNVNNGISLTRKSIVTQTIDIPLGASQQSNLEKNVPVSCTDYEKGMNWFGKFFDNDADACKNVKFKITQTTSADKSKKYYYVYTTSCSFNYETQKCEESKAPAEMEDAEFQARQSFDKLVEDAKNCLDYQQTNCRCNIDAKEIGRINLKSDFETVFTMQVEDNKLSLLTGPREKFGYVLGVTLKKPAIKTESITGIAPCYISKKTSAAVSSVSIKSMRKIEKFLLVTSQDQTEPEAVLVTPSTLGFGSYTYPIKDLIKLSDGSLCFVTKESNIADKLPVCSGEKKNLNEENSEVPYDSTWGDSVNQDTEQTANVCSPSEETNEDSTATQEDVSSEKTTGSVIAPLTGRSIGEAAVATQGFAKICPLILPSYNDKAFTAATSLEKNSYKKSLYQTINKFSEQYNANFNLVLAIIGVESNWDENLKEGNMYGLMQLTKYPVEDLKTGTCSKVFGPTSIDRYNREQNIKGGVMYLSCLIKKFNKNMPLAIAAYNIGPSEIVKNCKGTIESCSRATRGKAEKYLNKIAAEYVEIVASQEKLNPKIIVIDPGHGGKDPGALNPYKENKNEKVIALEISKKLQNILKSEGYTVLMTRDSDTFKELSERTVFSDAYYADLFVSIHANSFGTTPGEECSSKSGVEVEYFKNTKSSSPKLASTIANNIADVTGLELRGDKKDGAKASNFQVLRETEAPAVLVEPGFICNIKDAGIMADSAKQEKIADAIAEGISNFFG
jgi:N-acetylmuramoyl-L-alanine amidase